MLGAIGLWVISIVAGYLLYPENNLKTWGFFIALVILHSAELPISLRIGNEKGLSVLYIVTKTLLFGFTWWVPIKKGIFDK